MGRTGHPALILGAAAVVVAAVGVGVVLTRGPGPVAKATTTLSGVHDAALLAPDGHSARARNGERVPDGDTVVTRRGGSAALVTRGRIVYVEHSAAIAVVNGAHQQLRTGRAVVDALHGPGLRMDLATDVLTVPAGSATEATRSVSVSVGALAGPATVTSATARRLTIRALSQAVINGDALPSVTTPLHLDDRPAEARAVPALVGTDEAMRTLAAGIDSSGGSAAQPIEAAWTWSTKAAAPRAPSSERVLPMVIAQATAASGGTVEERYDHVVDWRRAGGSWGVVVAMLSGRSGQVEATFASLERHAPVGQIGTVTLASLATRHRHHTTTPAGRHSSGTTPTRHPSHPSGHHGHNGGGSPPKPKPTKPGGKGTVRGTVSGVVSTVLGLLPVGHHSTGHSTVLGGLLGH
jgi:hypothetical protein